MPDQSTQPAETNQSILLMSSAERQLAEVRTTDDALGLMSRAEVARVMALRSKLGTAAVNHATLIKIRAEKALARIVDQAQAAGEITTQANHGRGIQQTQHIRSAESPRPGGSAARTLEEVGVDDRRLAEARLLRDAFPDEELEQRKAQADAADEVMSRGQLVAEARARRPIPKPGGPRPWSGGGDGQAYLPGFELITDTARQPLSGSEWVAAFLESATPDRAMQLDATIDDAFRWLADVKDAWDVLRDQLNVAG